MGGKTDRNHVSRVDPPVEFTLNESAESVIVRRAVSIRSAQMRNSFRPAQFVHQDGTRFPRSRQERPSVYRDWREGGDPSTLRSPMVIKTEMIKTCLVFSGKHPFAFYTSSAFRISAPCWLNNGINDASGAAWSLDRDLKKRTSWRSACISWQFCISECDTSYATHREDDFCIGAIMLFHVENGREL